MKESLKAVSKQDVGNMDKSKSLEAALGQIEKQFGKGSIMKLGGDKAIAEIEGVSSGSLGLDIALGIGGFPKGRVIEIYGPESSGKTTLALHAIAEAQKSLGSPPDDKEALSAYSASLEAEVAKNIGQPPRRTWSDKLKDEEIYNRWN